MKTNLQVEKVSAAHFKIHTDIVIGAPAEKVWATLTDVASYKNWSAFMVALEGEIVDGHTITATFQLNPQKEKFNAIDHTIAVVEGVEFSWSEKGPLGIHDNHHFRVEAIDEHTSKFIQTDELTGGLTFLVGSFLSKLYAKGYADFNESLKREVERRVGS